MKITLNKWLNIKNKYTNIQIKDIINILFNYLYHYITKTKELNLLTDIDTFYNKFKEFIYNEYVYPIKKYNILENTNNEDYFDSGEYLLDYFGCKYNTQVEDTQRTTGTLLQNKGYQPLGKDAGVWRGLCTRKEIGLK